MSITTVSTMCGTEDGAADTHSASVHDVVTVSSSNSKASVMCGPDEPDTLSFDDDNDDGVDDDRAVQFGGAVARGAAVETGVGGDVDADGDDSGGRVLYARAGRGAAVETGVGGDVDADGDDGEGRVMYPRAARSDVSEYLLAGLRVAGEGRRAGDSAGGAGRVAMVLPSCAADALRIFDDGYDDDDATQTHAVLLPHIDDDGSAAGGVS